MTPAGDCPGHAAPCQMRSTWVHPCRSPVSSRTSWLHGLNGSGCAGALESGLAIPMTGNSRSDAARLNLGWVLEERARADPGREAVLGSGVRLTYTQLDAAANQVANLLVSCGFQPGDAAALSCPNRPEF